MLRPCKPGRYFCSPRLAAIRKNSRRVLETAKYRYQHEKVHVHCACRVVPRLTRCNVRWVNLTTHKLCFAKPYAVSGASTTLDTGGVVPTRSAFIIFIYLALRFFRSSVLSRFHLRHLVGVTLFPNRRRSPSTTTSVVP